MATVTGENYTYIDMKNDSGTVRHMLEDAQAREALRGGADYGEMRRGYYITSKNKWAAGADYVYAMIPVSGGELLEIKAGANVAIYAFLKSDYAGSATVDFADGAAARATVAVGEVTRVNVPATAKFLYVLANNVSGTYNQWLYWPERLRLDGADISWPLRWAADQNRQLALSAVRAVNAADGLPHLRDGFSIGSDGTWKVGAYQYALFPVSAGDVVTIRAGALNCFYAFICHDCIPGENRVAFAGNRTARDQISANGMATDTAPAGSEWLYVLYSIDTYSYWPKRIAINGVNVLGGVRGTDGGVFKYETGSFLNGVATERLTVGFPNGEKYIGYVLYRYVFPDNNCNLWRVYSFNEFDAALDVVRSLSAKGEMECAVSLAGRDDFSGGSTHGDEMMSAYAVFVDGEEITADLGNYGVRYPFRELRLVRTSKLYDPNDHTTEIADHGVEYVFTGGVMRIRQSLNWLVSDTLSNCYMAMFTPNKSCTDHFYTDLAQAPTAFPGDNYGNNYPNVRRTVAYGAGGFSGEFWIEEYPTGLTGGDRMLSTDNSGNDYNKLYYVICNAGQVTPGTVWRTTTCYRIRQA